MSGELQILASFSTLEARSGGFLFCRECRVAHRIDDADRAPIYTSDGGERSTDDRRAFLRAHEMHSLGALTRSGDAEVRSGPRWDPMVRTTFEASDGEAAWIVVSEREDVGGPRLYRVCPGRLELVEESVSLDEPLLREVVDDALFPYAASTALLDALVAEVRSRIERLPTEAFELVDEDRHEPEVELAGLPPGAVDALRALVGRLLPESEARRVIDLAERELRAELPVVRIRRRFAAVARD